MNVESCLATLAIGGTVVIVTSIVSGGFVVGHTCAGFAGDVMVLSIMGICVVVIMENLLLELGHHTLHWR